MSWLEWLLAVAALLALFVLWDLVFCGGRRCKRFLDQAPRDESGHRP